MFNGCMVVCVVREEDDLRGVDVVVLFLRKTIV